MFSSPLLTRPPALLSGLESPQKIPLSADGSINSRRQLMDALYHMNQEVGDGILLEQSFRFSLFLFTLFSKKCVRGVTILEHAVLVLVEAAESTTKYFSIIDL